MKSQLLGTVFSLILGWWGIPWGLVLTPIQIGRNLFGLTRPPEPSKPSKQFEKILRMNIAANALQQQQARIATVVANTP